METQRKTSAEPAAANRSLSNAHRFGLILCVVIAPLALGNGFAEELKTPFQLALMTPKGELQSPYSDPSSIADEGYKIYLSLDCGGCHGGGGGGGMAAPLTNPIWIYGDDDDTLFRVIALGTGSLSPGNAFDNQGHTRKGSEFVVAPMPPYGEIIRTENEIWKIIAWIRSKNQPN